MSFLNPGGVRMLKLGVVELQADVDDLLDFQRHDAPSPQPHPNSCNRRGTAIISNRHPSACHGHSTASVSNVSPMRPDTVGRDGMETKIAWRLWVFSLGLILAVLVGVSFFLDINTIGATGRFAWNALVAALLASARGFDTVLAYVLRGKYRRIAAFFTTVGLGYSGNVVLTHAQLERARGWRGTLRRQTGRMRQRWNALATPWKLACVAGVVALQIWLFPVLSEYVVLIPIGS